MKGNLLITATTIITLSGCGKEHGQVSGKVTLDSAPMANVRLCFIPEPKPEPGTVAPFTSAYTDEQGRYSLKTVEGQAGAVVGKYCVIFKDILSSKDRALPRKYQFSNQSPYQQLEVKPGDNQIDFDLQSDAGAQVGRR